MKTRHQRLRILGAFALVVSLSGLFVGACSFENSLSGLECEEENAARPGEVCRDGYWRIEVEADGEGTDLDVVSDTTPPLDGTPPPEDTTPDGTTPDGTTPDVIECNAPEELCGGVCVNTQTDNEHCGACGTVCPNGGAGIDACVGGECGGGAACAPGDEKECYTGTAATKNTGLCQTGIRTCGADGEWGACEGEVTPVTEVCDGQDNDCNNQIDDDNPGGGANCDTGELGICAAGIETCDEGEIKCVATQSAATQEDCGANGTGNGLDDTCDGNVDEGCSSCVDGETQPCYSGADGTEGTGVCQGGTQTCVGGEWGACDGERVPSQELCNQDGLDEDCDDNPGNGCECLNGEQRECGSDEGLCEFGTESCVGGQWSGVCEGAQGPAPEMCNGEDDDCDGSVDEDFPDLGDACPIGAGECDNGGVMVCAGDGSGTECNAATAYEVTYYVDNDGDGYGNPDTSLAIQSCAALPPGGYADNPDDCEDGDAAINPGATEVCDGQDNNCSETADDGSNMCGGSGSCQEGACCDLSDSGQNRCNGQFCDADSNNCASGYCEDVENRFGYNRNDICLPQHCDDDVQNGDETDIDCGGSCRKCLGEPCDNYYECKSDRCGWSSRVCVDD